jgi:hypothetical protein
MYGQVVLVALGAALVWLSTGGGIAIAATVVAAVSAAASISVARRERPKPGHRN